MRVGWFIALLVVAACGGDDTASDVGVDAGPDASVDGGMDARPGDAGSDGGGDGGMDAAVPRASGSPCERDGDCIGGRCLRDFTIAGETTTFDGGYCARPCDIAEDCLAGLEVCQQQTDDRVVVIDAFCLEACDTDGDCIRPGYTCFGRGFCYPTEVADAGVDAAADAAVDSAPPLRSCSGRAHGTTETRDCFDAPRAPPGGSCSSTVQTRTCDDGTWTPDWPPCDFFACGPGSALWIDNIGSAMPNESTTDGAVDSAGFAYAVSTRIGGNRDVHLQAYDASGAVRWTRTAGGTSSDSFVSVAVDAAGNVFAAGSSASATIDLGGGDLPLVSGDTNSPLLASYTRDNTLRWALRIPGSAIGQAIAVDPAGRVYVGGSVFDDIALEGTRVTAVGRGWVARYDNDGLVQRSRIIGTGVVGVGGDSAGNLYVAGSFDGTEDFGGTSRTGPGYFVASYQPDGTLRWVQELLGSLVLTSLAVSPAGQVAVSGSFSGTVDFGGGPLMASAVEAEPMIAVYDTDGASEYVKHIDTGGTSRATDVAYDSSGNLFVVGYMQGGFDFATETRFSLSGRVRVFWVSYDAAGTHRWSRIEGSTLNEEFGYGIGVGDYVVVTGQIERGFGVDSMAVSGRDGDGFILALAR